MAGNRCPGNPKVSGDLICHVTLLEECHFCAILSKYEDFPFAFAFIGLPVCVCLPSCGPYAGLPSVAVPVPAYMWPVCRYVPGCLQAAAYLATFMDKAHLICPSPQPSVLLGLSSSPQHQILVLTHCLSTPGELMSLTPVCGVPPM